KKVCRLTFVTENLELKGLDPDQNDPQDDVLDGLDAVLDSVDADVLDQRDEQRDADIKAQGAAPESSPPPLQPADPPKVKPTSPLDAPEEGGDSDEAAAFAKRLKNLLPHVVEAMKHITDPVKARLNAGVSEARTFARKQQFDSAHDKLDWVEDI